MKSDIVSVNRQKSNQYYIDFFKGFVECVLNTHGKHCLPYDSFQNNKGEFSHDPLALAIKQLERNIHKTFVLETYLRIGSSSNPKMLLLSRWKIKYIPHIDGRGRTSTIGKYSNIVMKSLHCFLRSLPYYAFVSSNKFAYSLYDPEYSKMNQTDFLGQSTSTYTFPSIPTQFGEFAIRVKYLEMINNNLDETTAQVAHLIGSHRPIPIPSVQKSNSQEIAVPSNWMSKDKSTDTALNDSNDIMPPSLTRNISKSADSKPDAYLNDDNISASKVAVPVGAKYRKPPSHPNTELGGSFNSQGTSPHSIANTAPFYLGMSNYDSASPSDGDGEDFELPPFQIPSTDLHSTSPATNTNFASAYKYLMSYSQPKSKLLSQTGGQSTLDMDNFEEAFNLSNLPKSPFDTNEPIKDRDAPYHLPYPSNDVDAFDIFQCDDISAELTNSNDDLPFANQSIAANNEGNAHQTSDSIFIAGQFGVPPVLSSFYDNKLPRPKEADILAQLDDFKHYLQANTKEMK